MDDETFQALVKFGLSRVAFAVNLLVVGQFAAQFLLKRLLVHVLGRAHVEVQHGMLRPLGF